ncbi:putative Protein kinase domain [Monocercomonoides exilis]|uniref:putative Protein kinase domain n=1 Tax=Monocercomonoides exilis TaxID=2049356 RepID=UPI00355A8158|nr:putative Protein kinase domain [Monocercomonoides exilis]|eukprot:MONOS_10994.1-p1 / transcript=MONOS_10994.1 / gene=MONOS_10994 / organism=Monocercomonoides_exilis_PA203 / gene_product=unspecified product / transcript_product=unspecified product / location=Mono_scaffold00526:28235-31253(+) / protein_length=749 / sequence_SO=supercontig / SO=protein_coding / is_pseudo=false
MKWSMWKHNKKERKQITENFILQCAAEVGQGLYDLYISKIIHRDIKLENIFLTNNLHFKIGDLGLGRNCHSRPRNIHISGTPAFIAPEVVSGQQPTYKSDVWAYGKMLLQMTSFLNYSDEAPPAPRQIVLPPLNSLCSPSNSTYSSPSASTSSLPPLLSSQSFLKDISPFLKNFIFRCLNQDPEKRPSAVEIVALPEFHERITTAKQHIQLLSELSNLKKGSFCEITSSGESTLRHCENEESEDEVEQLRRERDEFKRRAERAEVREREEARKRLDLERGGLVVRDATEELTAAEAKTKKLTRSGSSFFGSTKQLNVDPAVQTRDLLSITEDVVGIIRSHLDNAAALSNIPLNRNSSTAASVPSSPASFVTNLSPMRSSSSLSMNFSVSSPVHKKVYHDMSHFSISSICSVFSDFSRYLRSCSAEKRAEIVDKRFFTLIEELLLNKPPSKLVEEICRIISVALLGNGKHSVDVFTKQLAQLLIAIISVRSKFILPPHILAFQRFTTNRSIKVATTLVSEGCFKPLLHLLHHDNPCCKQIAVSCIANILFLGSLSVDKEDMNPFSDALEKRKGSERFLLLLQETSTSSDPSSADDMPQRMEYARCICMLHQALPLPQKFGSVVSFTWQAVENSLIRVNSRVRLFNALSLLAVNQSNHELLLAEHSIEKCDSLLLSDVHEFYDPCLRFLFTFASKASTQAQSVIEDVLHWNKVSELGQLENENIRQLAIQLLQYQKKEQKIEADNKSESGT